MILGILMIKKNEQISNKFISLKNVSYIDFGPLYMEKMI